MISELTISILESPLFRLFIIGILIKLLYDAACGPGLYPGFPAAGVDPKDGYSRGLSTARENWLAHGKEILDQGVKKVFISVSLSRADCAVTDISIVCGLLPGLHRGWT